MKWDAKKWLRVIQANKEGYICVNARGIYIFPTRYGFMYGVAIFVMLLGSLNYGSNLGLLFTFVFVGVGIVAILHTWTNLLGIELRISTPTPVFAGTTAVFFGQLSTAGNQQKPRLRISAGTIEEESLDVYPGKRTPFQLKVKEPVRGDIPLERIRISSVFPLGFLRAWCYAQTSARVLVYPRPSDSEPLNYSPRYERSDIGDKGFGADDFVGLRPYRTGDPPRHLDWKAFSRERGLVIRQFGGDRAEQIWLDWNSLHGLDTEQRLSRLCRMVLDASGHDVRYGLSIPGVRIPPGSGEAHKHICLSALARFI